MFQPFPVPENHLSIQDVVELTGWSPSKVTKDLHRGVLTEGPSVPMNARVSKKTIAIDGALEVYVADPEAPTNKNPCVNVREAADQLGCESRTIYNRLDSGKLTRGPNNHSGHTQVMCDRKYKAYLHTTTEDEPAETKETVVDTHPTPVNVAAITEDPQEQAIADHLRAALLACVDDEVQAIALLQQAAALKSQAYTLRNTAETRRREALESALQA